ncbi:MAG: adenylate cyclase [Actinomycetota bacterium]|jgi:class 3 adenylate cyclase
MAVDKFAEWFWQRFRGRFFVAIGVLVTVFDCGTLLIPFAIIVGGLWHLSGIDTLQICGLTILAAIIAVSAGIGTNVTFRGIVTRWVDGDHSHPELVRDAVLAGPEGMAMRGGLLGSPFLLLVVVPILAVKLDFSLRGFVAVELMGMLALALAAFLMANGLRLLTAPLLFEIAAEMPVDVHPLASTWSLRSLFGVGMFLGAALAGVAGGIAAFTFHGTKQTSALAAVIAAFVMGTYAALLNRFGVIEPTLAPLRDLVRATHRVAEGDYTHTIPVTSTDEFGELVVAFNSMMIGLQQRTALHAAFGSYVDPSLAARLLLQETSVFAGETVDATVFFADVRGFTNYAETVDADQAVARLNQLFDIVVPAIRAAGGHPNRYIGDGVLAVFGTPEPLKNHANRAVSAAVMIQREVRRVFGSDLRLGIGINSGKMIAGTIGGGGKLDFTVIGDVVNVAARVEELTKETGDCILITKDTMDSVRAPAEIVVDRGPRMLRGRAEPVHVFAIEA